MDSRPELEEELEESKRGSCGFTILEEELEEELETGFFIGPFA